jgi:cell wall-associated NlpC family hydrolase
MKIVIGLIMTVMFALSGALKEYTIQKGDTLYRVARNHAMTIKELLAANPKLTYRSTLSIGQKIKVATYAQPTRPYVVRPGDSPLSLARTFKMPIRDLIRANETDFRRQRLVVGQTIRIKESMSFAQKIVKDARQYLGVRYKWGGNNPKRGIDCSRFAQLVYKKHGIELPRVSGDQYAWALKHGKKVSMREAQKGDLIFFRTRHRRIGHVGIIIDPKKHLFQQSSSGAGKNTISRYDIGSYRRRLRGICRIRPNRSAKRSLARRNG